LDFLQVHRANFQVADAGFVRARADVVFAHVDWKQGPAAMALGPTLNYLGFNAVKMLLRSAVINALLASPLILLVILLTSNDKVMEKRVNSPLLRYLGWATFVAMTAAAARMLFTF